jgi:hypothetical protein
VASPLPAPGFARRSLAAGFAATGASRPRAAAAAADSSVNGSSGSHGETSAAAGEPLIAEEVPNSTAAASASGQHGSAAGAADMHGRSGDAGSQNHGGAENGTPRHAPKMLARGRPASRCQLSPRLL